MIIKEWQLILFQPFVHTGKTAVRFIAGDIQKGAFLLADGAVLRRLRRNQCIAAIAAFPCIFWNVGISFSHCLPP